MSSTIDTPETSVIVSLAELADIEAKRVDEEARQRALQRAAQAREQARAQREAANAEAARVAAAAEARKQRELDKAKTIAQSKAREQAGIEIARIAAESKARLEADNAARAHELAILRVNNDRGRVRLRRVLAAVLGAVLLAGTGAAFAVNSHVQHLEQQSQQLREDRWALVQQHDKEMAAELMALDRRHEALRNRSGAAAAKGDLKRVAEARAAVEAGGVDGAKLRAIAEALDALEARVDRAELLAQHDRRLKDLATWARSARKNGKLTADAGAAAARAHRAPEDDRALAAYGRALDVLRDKLSTTDGAVAVGPRPAADQIDTGTGCNNPHDPLCGLDGKQLGTR